MRNLNNKKSNNKRNSLEEKSRRGFYRASYHRHFEGYSEFEVIDDKGHARIKRVYTGEYYSHDFDRKQRIILKSLLSVLWIVSCGLLVVGAVQTDVGNEEFYVAIWQAGDIVGLAWAFFGLFNYLTSPSKMTVGEWRGSSQRLIRGSLCAAIFLAATAISILVHMMVSIANTGKHIFCVMCFMLAAVCMFAEWRIEHKVSYNKTASKETAPDYAARIR